MYPKEKAHDNAHTKTTDHVDGFAGVDVDVQNGALAHASANAGTAGHAGANEYANTNDNESATARANDKFVDNDNYKQQQ